MFEQNQPLPSDYGYAGGTPSQLSSLTPTEGAIGASYGKIAAKGEAAPTAAAPSNPLEAFTQGLTTAVQGFQSSGKSSAPALPAAPAAPAAPPASERWKSIALATGATLLIGGAVWWFMRPKTEERE